MIDKKYSWHIMTNLTLKPGNMLEQVEKLLDVLVGGRPRKTQKFTQSKFDIFFLHKPFSDFYKVKVNCGNNLKIYTYLKKCTHTWFAGLPVFPGLGWVRIGIQCPAWSTPFSNLC